MVIGQDDTCKHITNRFTSQRIERNDFGTTSY
jgi:hypothetical protein